MTSHANAVGAPDYRARGTFALACRDVWESTCPYVELSVSRLVQSRVVRRSSRLTFVDEIDLKIDPMQCVHAVLCRLSVHTRIVVLPSASCIFAIFACNYSAIIRHRPPAGDFGS